MNKIIAMAEEAGFVFCRDEWRSREILETLLSRFRNLVLEEALNCYSPDDTAQDWADKIRALKGEKP